ncbi:MAG TPA: AAA family ATPase, partial [Candidatus Acidoferrum sp.]|nr:AAA family ATPase [Candidatus Acidoferrum sp.]
MLQISVDDILKRLSFDNPWWEPNGNKEIAYQNNPRRKYFASFYAGISDISVRRAIVLMGPRRVGKTVMVFHAIRGLLDKGINPNSILYLSLETPIYTGLPLERIVLLFQ